MSRTAAAGGSLSPERRGHRRRRPRRSRRRRVSRRSSSTDTFLSAEPFPQHENSCDQCSGYPKTLPASLAPSHGSRSRRRQIAAAPASLPCSLSPPLHPMKISRPRRRRRRRMAAALTRATLSFAQPVTWCEQCCRAAATRRRGRRWVAAAPTPALCPLHRFLDMLRSVLTAARRRRFPPRRVVSPERDLLQSVLSRSERSGDGLSSSPAGLCGPAPSSAWRPRTGPGRSCSSTSRPAALGSCRAEGAVLCYPPRLPDDAKRIVAVDSESPLGARSSFLDAIAAILHVSSTRRCFTGLGRAVSSCEENRRRRFPGQHIS
jgi:hypothetical protein